MPYLLVDNFASGLDTRKSPLTSAAGTLTRLTNAVITPGGEISKRRAFAQCADLSASFGLAATASKLWVFGRNVAPGAPDPGVPGVTLGGLLVPNAGTTYFQTDYDVFDGLVYMTAHEPGVSFRHYYQVAAAPTTMVETEGSGQKGSYIRTFDTKMYSVLGQYLHFSDIGDPKKWVPHTGTLDLGAGNINVSTLDADSEVLSSLEVYYDKLAVFSTKAVQIWNIHPDQAQNAFDQLLRGSGTTAPRSPLQYGSGDVLFLDPSGIRSLKAKDSSNSASVSDIGSPVDPVVQTMRATLGDAYMSGAVSLLEPSVGRFWMVFPSQILVLSYFPGPKVTAWSMFTLPELGAARVEHAVACGGRIFLRDSLHRLWVYGGTAGTLYNNCGVEVRLPYLDAKKPGHKKQFTAIDATVSGTWEVKISYNFNDSEAEETVGIITEPTWNTGALELQGYDSHFSLRFHNNDDSAATLSNCAVHYNIADDEV